MALADAIRFVNDLHTNDQLRQTVHVDRDHIFFSASAVSASAAGAAPYTFTAAELRQALSQYWAAHPPDDPASRVLSEAPGF